MCCFYNSNNMTYLKKFRKYKLVYSFSLFLAFETNKRAPKNEIFYFACYHFSKYELYSNFYLHEI